MRTSHPDQRRRLMRPLTALLVCASLLAATLPLALTGPAPAPTHDDRSPVSVAETPAAVADDLLAIADAPDGGAPDAETGAEALLDAADDEHAADWLDTAAGTAEIMVFFADDGVTGASRGNPELAAAQLKRDASERWQRIDAELGALEAEGRVTVLNRFWVTTAVLVDAEATPETLAALRALPGATDVVPNYTVEPLETTEPIPTDAPPATLDELETAAELPVTYGIDQINADDAWRDFDATGTGVRVAVLDTGVDATHPDIGPRLVGRDTGDPSYPGGWINFDRTGSPIVTKPTDPGSHGTHVAGTVLGGDASGTRIGVAPDAELMAANVLSGGGSTAKIYAALEWVISPFDGNGVPAGRAADVINMSLGSGDFADTMAKAIRNVRDAGIFPAIAIGNDGLGSTSVPGNLYDAVGVGMTNRDDAIDTGSSGGVIAWGQAITTRYGWPESYVKPDISAPGVGVFSAMPGGLWGESTGTSMATPHVAGAVALMRSAQAGLTVDEMQEALERTAWHPSGSTSTPDTRYGHGRIDIHAAITDVLGQSGVRGVVTDSVTGAPVAGATVSYGDRGETWVTDAEGRFTARLAPGAYTLTVTRFGYASAATQLLTVVPDAFGSVSVALAPITTGSVSGIVLDHDTQRPLSGATVTVIGHPVQATTGPDGSYTLTDLPVGDYRLRASAEGRRDLFATAVTVVAALETTVNFRLAGLTRVLVLGDNGERTSALLRDNDFVATSLAEAPTDPAAYADVDAVLWDTPTGEIDEELLGEVITATDASGTGIVWLDLGSSESSGIGSLHHNLGNPAERSAQNDRTAQAVGYRVTQSHDIFAGGIISPETLTPGNVIVQNSANGPKFAAWFEGLTGTDVTVLAETVVQHRDPEDERRTLTEAKGTGIAVDQRATNRHVFLALHGSSPAVDARNWQTASVQVLLNAVTWASPAVAQAPDPEIIVPKPPVIRPGDGGNPGGVPNTGGATPQPSALAPAVPSSAAPAPAQRAAQNTAKPTITPDPPVSSINLLTGANASGVTARVAGGIAHVTIPGAKPGDWFFLHVYPSATAVDWIRVNDDGELRIDVARLAAGTYTFAFTAADLSFAGWVRVTVGGSLAAEQVGAPSARAAGPDAAAPLADDAAPRESAGGFSLSQQEQFMLLGATALLLAAAAVVFFGMRKPKTPTTSGTARA